MSTVEIDLDLITSEMDEIKKEEARLKFELKQLEQEKEKRELQLSALLSQLDVKECNHGIYSFGFKISKRKAFDQKLFSTENPELFERYKVEKEKEDFYFKING